MFEVTPIPGGKRIRFSNTLENLDRTVDEVVTWVSRRSAAANLFDVKLLLREALLNAVLHGNAANPLKAVSVEAVIAGGRLTVSVEDQGRGFDWQAGLMADAKPSATHGRGLAILRRYADEVRYNAPGNRVTLVKSLTAQDQGPDGQEVGLANQTGRVIMSETRFEEGRAILRPGKDIVASMADELRGELKRLLEVHTGAVALDLAGVELIDSVGIGLLIAAHNSLLRTGQRLVLFHVNEDLSSLFRTMRLDKHFLIETA